MLRPSVVSLSVRNVLWPNGASYRTKVTIDSLLEVVYEKSIGTKVNDVDLCLEVSRSCQSLPYIWRWISRKPSVIEAWFQRTPISNNLRESHDRWRYVTLKGQTRDPNTLRAQYLENGWRRYAVPKDHEYEMACGVSNGHVTDDVTWSPKVLWGSTVVYPSDSLASCSPKLCSSSESFS